MKFSKIRIHDFRSILYQEINLLENCTALIGLNESGKSNVLNAIRLFDFKFPLSPQDRSKISKKLPKVECEFLIGENEILEIKAFAAGLISQYITKTPIELIFPPTIILYVEAIDSGDSLQRKIAFKYPITTSKSIKLSRPSTTIEIPEDLQINLGDQTVEVKTIKAIEANLIPEDLEKYFVDFDFDDLIYDVLAYCEKTYSTLRSPQVIFWAYDPKYLLPSEISYDALMLNDNPYENSTPLYNIFVITKPLGISNVEHLKRKVTAWKSDSSERRKDGAIITQMINSYIQKIWSDYDQELRIELEELKITIHINDPKSQEKNFYAMEARSQGFKTFISFILTIAAEAENGIISNFILLLDEPETHLHPSGVRYMRDELMKLGSFNNYIFYSTHSIFMIDRQNLRRHIIVQKENEITRLKEVKSNNFIQEGVIYEAMGTQLDEFSIPTKNLIVEGELDLLLLSFYIKLFNDQELQKHIKECKIWDGGGTKNITTFFEKKLLPHSSLWFVILDNDKPGQKLKEWLTSKFVAANGIKISASTYSEVDNFEIEDILPKEFIQNSFDFANNQFENIHGNILTFANDNTVVSELINDFKRLNKFSQEQDSFFEVSFKQKLFGIVDERLQNISKITEINDRRKVFFDTFPLYHKSISKIILKKPPK